MFFGTRRKSRLEYEKRRLQVDSISIFFYSFIIDTLMLEYGGQELKYASFTPCSCLSCYINVHRRNSLVASYPISISVVNSSTVTIVKQPT